MYTPAYLFAPSWVAGNALHARGMGATYRPLSIQIAVHVAAVHVHASTQDVTFVMRNVHPTEPTTLPYRIAWAIFN
jgi:hypothetical protein